jgi:hypothetical protein
MNIFLRFKFSIKIKKEKDKIIISYQKKKPIFRPLKINKLNYSIGRTASQ